MKKIIIISLCIMFMASVAGAAPVTDGFEDGDFSSSPQWNESYDGGGWVVSDSVGAYDGQYYLKDNSTDAGELLALDSNPTYSLEQDMDHWSYMYVKNDYSGVYSVGTLDSPIYSTDYSIPTDQYNYNFRFPRMTCGISIFTWGRGSSTQFVLATISSNSVHDYTWDEVGGSLANQIDQNWVKAQFTTDFNNNNVVAEFYVDGNRINGSYWDNNPVSLPSCLNEGYSVDDVALNNGNRDYAVFDEVTYKHGDVSASVAAPTQEEIVPDYDTDNYDVEADCSDAASGYSLVSNVSKRSMLGSATDYNAGAVSSSIDCSQSPAVSINLDDILGSTYGDELPADEPVHGQYQYEVYIEDGPGNKIGTGETVNFSIGTADASAFFPTEGDTAQFDPVDFDASLISNVNGTFKLNVNGTEYDSQDVVKTEDGSPEASSSNLSASLSNGPWEWSLDFVDDSGNSGYNLLTSANPPILFTVDLSASASFSQLFPPDESVQSGNETSFYDFIVYSNAEGTVSLMHQVDGSGYSEVAEFNHSGNGEQTYSINSSDPRLDRWDNGVWNWYIEYTADSTGETFQSDTYNFEVIPDTDQPIVSYQFLEPESGEEFGTARNVDYEIEIVSEYNGNATVYFEGNETGSYSFQSGTSTYEGTVFPQSKGLKQLTAEAEALNGSATASRTFTILDQLADIELESPESGAEFQNEEVCMEWTVYRGQVDVFDRNDEVRLYLNGNEISTSGSSSDAQNYVHCVNPDDAEVKEGSNTWYVEFYDDNTTDGTSDSIQSDQRVFNVQIKEGTVDKIQNFTASQLGITETDAGIVISIAASGVVMVGTAAGVGGAVGIASGFLSLMGLAYLGLFPRVFLLSLLIPVIGFILKEVV